MLSLELWIVQEAMRISPPMVSFKLYLRNALKSSFYNLTMEFSTSDKTRAPINTKLTPTIEELIKGNLIPKKEQDGLFKKNPRPENCNLLVSSKLNRNIWNQLSPSTKSTGPSESSTVIYFLNLCQYQCMKKSIQSVEGYTCTLSRHSSKSVTAACVHLKLTLTQSGGIWYNQNKTFPYK